MLWIDIAVHWLHLMAAAVWAGGMIFAGFVLTPVARRDLPPNVRYPLFKAVGERFAVLGRGALTVLFATGIYKLSQVWNADHFWTSNLGRVISVKLCLVFTMLLLSALHDFVWGPQLAKLAGRTEAPEYKLTLSRLSFWSGVNMALVITIVFLSATIRMNPF